MDRIIYNQMNHVTRRYVALVEERDDLMEFGDLDQVQDIEEILEEMQENRLLNKKQVGQYFS